MAAQVEQGRIIESQKRLSSDDVLDYMKLLELPLDVLYSILSHLHPRDRECLISWLYRGSAVLRENFPIHFKQKIFARA